MNLQETRELNQRWANLYNSDDGIVKAAAFNRKWLSDHVPEASFFMKLCPPQTVTPEECDRSVNSKTPCMIEEIREGSWAMPIDFSGSTMAEVIPGARYLISFQKLQTATHYYYLEELWTSKRPVLQHLKEDMAEALADAYDRMFLVHTETAVWYLFQAAYTGIKLNNTTLNDGTAVEVSVFKSEGAKLVTDAVGNPANTFATQALRKEDGTILLRAFNTREGEQLEAANLLITNYDFYGVSDWDLNEIGDAAVARSVEGTLGYNKLKGINLVRTGKQRWLRPGNIYAWAPWNEYVGNHYQIGGVDTYQEKRGTRVEMFSWRIGGFGYGDVAGARKMELYSGSANPQTVGATDDTGVANVRPKAVTHRIKNHRADEGHWFPGVTMF